MPVPDNPMRAADQRSNWVRLRTLVGLRWFAICGQVVATLVAVNVFDLRLHTDLIVMVIGASVITNLFSTFLSAENRRLAEHEAFGMLLFDIIQLGFLIFLAGGLSNPFAILIMAPVTIAATVLPMRSTVALGAAAIAVVSFAGVLSLPIQTASGAVLEMPRLFQFGFWVALVIGLVFLAIYARLVTTEIHAMGDALLATQLALGRAQKLTDLGGVVAAAAHELGSPLATIKIASSELKGDLSDRPDLLEDVVLIGQQADRCRDILRSMGQAGKDDLHLHHAPLEAVVRESAEPHLERGKAVLFDVAALDGASPVQPVLARQPEIIHGLRNLIQNAVDFAAERIEIDINWSEREMIVRISDDGAGFPSSILGRIGVPFVRRRRPGREARPGYEGMGLGLFIAKTLLERSGASLRFANSPGQGAAHGGAVVTVTWARQEPGNANGPTTQVLGENRLIE